MPRLGFLLRTCQKPGENTRSLMPGWVKPLFWTIKAGSLALERVSGPKSRNLVPGPGSGTWDMSGPGSGTWDMSGPGIWY